LSNNLKHVFLDIIFIKGLVQIKDVNEWPLRKLQKPKSQRKLKLFKNPLQETDIRWDERWRGVRDLNPRGPKDHRLSRLRLQFCPFGRL
jgi:hypothetical protein